MPAYQNGVNYACLPGWCELCLPARMVWVMPAYQNGVNYACLPEWCELCLPTKMVWVMASHFQHQHAWNNCRDIG